jgi:hypothetical protein
MIVVGERAAVSDIIASTWIATQVGAMAYVDEPVSILAHQDVVYSQNEALPNASDKEDDGVTGIQDFLSASTGPESYVLLPHDAGEAPLWDYDLYIDAFSSFEGNWLVDTGYSYESLSIDFSIRDTNDGQTFCEQCSASKTQTPDFDGRLTLTQTYPALFPRHYWGTLEGETLLDPVGGIAYRSTVYRMPQQPDITYEGWSVLVGDNAPPQYAMITNPMPRPANVVLLGSHYDILEFGTDANGYDYALYGTPKTFTVDAVTDTMIQSVEGVSVSVEAIDVYHGTVTMGIRSPYVDPKTAMLAKGESLIIYEEITPGVVRPVQCITLSSISIRSERTAMFESTMLTDYGAITECIFAVDEPYVTCNGIEWFLDIMPGDDVQAVDIDNDESLYLAGNPSYSASDSLKLFDSEEVAPYFEVWMATPVEIVGIVDETLTGCLTNSKGEEVLSFEVTDTDHKDLLVDSVRISQKKTVVSNSTRHYIEIDTSKLAVTDTHVGPTEKSEYNLILIGGPVANDIVGELLALGITSGGTWASSNGDVILYRDVFVTGKDVLVVAGKDREATTAAARMLLDIMSTL